MAVYSLDLLYVCGFCFAYFLLLEFLFGGVLAQTPFISNISCALGFYPHVAMRRAGLCDSDLSVRPLQPVLYQKRKDFFTV